MKGDEGVGAGGLLPPPQITKFWETPSPFHHLIAQTPSPSSYIMSFCNIQWHFKIEFEFDFP